MKNYQLTDSLHRMVDRWSLAPQGFWMKVSFIIITVLFLGIQPTIAHPDEKPGLEDEKVNLNVRDQSLPRIFREIEKQTSLHFAYDPKLVIQYSATISGNPISVEAALKIILKNKPLTYSLINDKILITKVQSQSSLRTEPLKPNQSLPLFDSPDQFGINISGKVTDQSGEALIGVNIQVKGTAKGTVTDFDGLYTIDDVDDQAILVFSYIGFEAQEIPVGGQTTIDVVLLPDAQMLDEVIVIGYGTVKKSDLTGSVASINVEKFQNQPVTQISEMLTGTVAGFNANQSTSAAGGASMEIRGRNSLNASTTPMIVLDGVIYNGSINDINPNDVASIDILKDASSAAVFGARAASGVVIITTKRGAKGTPKINFSTKWGATAITSDHYGARSPQEYIDFRVDYFRTVDTDFPEYHYLSPDNLPADISLDEWRSTVPNPNADDEVEWLNRLNFYRGEIEAYQTGNTTDWHNEVMRTGIRQESDLSVSGGTDNARYFWSVGYTDNEGIIRGDEFSVVRSRLNVDFDVTNWLKVGANVQFSGRDESAIAANLGQMQIVTPFGKLRDESGDLVWYPGDSENAQNPLIDTYGQEKERKINSLFSSVFADVKLPFGINYRLSYQPRIQTIRDYNYWSPKTIVGSRSYDNGRATRLDYHQYEWMIDNLLKWNKEFGNHNFDVTFLYNAEKNSVWQTSTTNNTFYPSPSLGFSGIQFGINPALSASDSEITGDGLMGRINYSYLSKYLLTMSVRRDGFSAFGQENPRAVFPAAAFAWVLSEEKFFNLQDVNQLKLRTSWGLNGNRDIGGYAALAQLSSNQYSDGTNLLIGVSNSTLANRSLIWEETESLNFGIDASLLNYRLNISVDYYDMDTRNLLVRRILPSTTGFSNVTTNIGKLGNQGIELTVGSVNVSSSAFEWRTDLNFSINRNKLKNLFGEYGDYVLEGKELYGEVPDYENEWFIGRPIDAIWNYDILGMWQVEEAEAAREYNLKPGDIKGFDRNEDGKYEALYDKSFIGYKEPRYRVGLRNEISFLKNFTANIFLRADLGHSGQFSQALADWSTLDRRGVPKGLGYWTPDNRTDEWPRLSKNVTPYGGGIQFYKPRSFLRVQDVSLAYNLPQSALSSLRIDNIRVFAAVRNLMTFTDWPGYDPESMHSPMPRTFTAGLNVSL